MKKVLILSYYFPPCNLTAANRIGGWYKYLPENNFYPIVITRNWTGNELTEESRLMDSGKEIRVEKKEDSEVHYLPYKASWRDNCFVKGKNNKFFALVSKLLTTLMTVLQNFTIKAIPYNNLYYYIQNFLKENKDVKTLIISGNPFEQFYFGYLLKKEFPDLKWVADYRDDWTTNELYKKNSPLYKVINRYNRHFELKWLKSSSKIITVSNLYASRLAKLHEKEVYVVMNGFPDKIMDFPKNSIIKYSDKFVISYSGSIYESQDFSILFEGVNKFAIVHPKLNIKVQFIGAKGFKIKNKEFNSSNNNYNFDIEISDRLPWSEAYLKLKESNVLFLTSYGNLKGIPTSKLFEYITTDVPIILAPSDNDIMESIILQTKTGYICEDKEGVYSSLKEIYTFDNYNPNWIKIRKYSSELQIKKLVNLIK